MKKGEAKKEKLYTETEADASVIHYVDIVKEEITYQCRLFKENADIDHKSLEQKLKALGKKMDGINERWIVSMKK